MIHFFINLAEHYGLYGIGAGMALESMGVPFAGMTMALASVPLVNEGKATYTSIIAVATIGTTLGSLISYYMGYFFGSIVRRYHRGHLVNREDILNRFVDRYGEGAVFFAQLFGASRSFISLPAGVVKLNLKKFLIGTIAGSIIINIAMVIANIYLYKTWKDVSEYFGVPMWFSIVISSLFILGVVTLYKKKIKEFLNGNNKDRKMHQSERQI